MKKILLIPLLLLCSCGVKEQVYYNVTTTYDNDNVCYNVEISEQYYPELKDRFYKVSIENVYFVKVEQYFCAESCSRLALNEFHIKGKSYKLVFYQLK